MTKVLITGGAGFIGYHLTRLLAGEDYEVTICDNLFRGKIDSDLKELCEHGNVKFINCDLVERGELKKLEGEWDYIYHLAAINGTRYFYEIPHEVLRVNVLSLINLLEWARDAHAGKILFASSSEVYAGTARAFDLPVPTPENVCLTIDDVYNPRLSYAGSKIIGELFMINYSRAYNLPITIVRYHNIYGPRMGYEHVIPGFCMRILGQENPFKIHGATETRAFCYIDDAIKATRKVAEVEGTSGEIIHVGNSDEEIKIIDLARRMFALSDFYPTVESLPAPEGSVKRRQPDISKLVQLTGFRPQVSLNEGLLKTLEWYKKWYRKPREK